MSFIYSLIISMASIAALVQFVFATIDTFDTYKEFKKKEEKDSSDVFSMLVDCTIPVYLLGISLVLTANIF